MLRNHLSYITLRFSTSPSRAYSTALSKIGQARVLPSFSLQDKTCVVTGAARGLGYEFCKAFVRSGCNRLGILDLRKDEAQGAADALLQELEEAGEIGSGTVDAVGLECDVASEQSVKLAFSEMNTRWGRIDCAVASAGESETVLLRIILHTRTYPHERLKRLYDINVHGAFFTAREAAKYMAAQGGGSIILIASMSAHDEIINIPQPQTPYNASKAAVKHMASSLALEWAKDGVRVNSLSPGYMLTKLTKTILAQAEDQTLKKRWESLTPMGKMGDPEDLAGAIVFLASDASGFVTGADIRVDGGYCVI